MTRARQSRVTTDMSEPATTQPPTIAFAGAALDRADHLRDDAHTLVSGDTSRVILVGPGQQVALADRRSLDRTPMSNLPAGAPLTFLGLDPTEVAIFAADAVDLRLDDAHAFTPLRELMTELDPAEAALGAYAVGMVGWHRVHRHCGRCGVATHIEHAGHRRRCPNCGLVHFPRTDPAVTMLVQHKDGDRALLSRRHGAPEHRWSALAGFVEPGETPEEAVIREAREETGIQVTAVEYVTSQPWPFPSALMIGFWAFADPDAGDPPTADGGELVDARWFDRADLAARVNDRSIGLPPPGSIGNYLISTWLASGS
jgi:NAD+ diphosphatase